jgi:hypothetical protein
MPQSSPAFRRLFTRPDEPGTRDHRQVYQVIQIHPAAPAKPESGAPCNGCGICCASEPCPVGALLSRRRSGACVALSWSPTDSIYRCGLVDDAAALLPAAWRGAAPLVARLAKRFIAAGVGCDCSLEVAG